MSGPETAELRCSRAGCRAPAVFGVHWRNPRIHSADRVKTWTACPEHRDFLVDYLSSRAFPTVTTPVGQVPSRLDGPGPA